MKRALLVALVVLGGALPAEAQPVLIPWRPPAGCATNDVIKFNGTLWTCGSVSTFSTLNAIPVGNGTGMIASGLTDDGTTIGANRRLAVTVSGGTAAVIAGTATKSWALLPFNNDLQIFEYGTTYGVGGGSARVTIAAGGSVGIGDTTPDYLLDVAGTLGVDGVSTFGGQMTIIESGGAGFGLANANLIVGDTTAAAAGVGGMLAFHGAYTGTTRTTGAAIKAMKSNGTDGDYSFDLAFGTRQNGIADVGERMRITSAGNVTINAPTSGTALTVSGSTSVAGATTLGAGLTLTGTLTANATAGTNGDVLTMVSGLPKWQSLATSGIVTGTGTSGKSARWNGTALTTGAFTDDGTNASIAGTFAATGDVGIGASPSTSHRLLVQKDQNGASNLTLVNTTNNANALAQIGASRTTGYTDDFVTMGVTAPSYATIGHITFIQSKGAPLKIGTADAEPVSIFTNGFANPRLTIDATGAMTVNGATDFDSTLNVDGAATLNGDTTIGNANTDTLTITAKIGSNVHYTGTSTTVSSCGTASASVSGNNRRGKIVPGTGSPTSCTLNFAGGGDAWSSAPVCQVSGRKGTEQVTSVSTTQLVISVPTGWASVAGGGTDEPVYYSCDGL